MKLLLDSQVLVWSVRSTGLLSARARRTLDAPANELFVSVVSLWELTIKTALGKLSLPGTAEEAASRPDAVDLPIRRAHLARLRELPQLHKDPFDRMIVAQAIEEGDPPPLPRRVALVNRRPATAHRRRAGPVELTSPA